MGDDDKVKHLEMIQAVITRMANNSFLLKGWSLTLISGMLAFAVNEKKWFIALLALLPSIAFWWLDGFFLSQERRYRALYDKVRLPDDETRVDFSMVTPTDAEDPELGLESAMWSKTLKIFHGVLVAAVVIVLGYTVIRYGSPTVTSSPWETPASGTKAPDATTRNQGFRPDSERRDPTEGLLGSIVRPSHSVQDRRSHPIHINPTAGPPAPRASLSAPPPPENARVLWISIPIFKPLRIYISCIFSGSTRIKYTSNSLLLSGIPRTRVTTGMNLQLVLVRTLLKHLEIGLEERFVTALKIAVWSSAIQPAAPVWSSIFHRWKSFSRVSPSSNAW